MCVCEFFFFYYYFYFLLKETEGTDDGRCLCMSVCTDMELNWFPGKGK